MAFSLSPGVNVTEIDLTTIIPAVSTTDGAIVGDFRWGPCDEIILVSSEDELVSSYGRPDTDNAAVWFTAASFLAYGNKLRLVRVIKSDAKNANKSSGTILVKNDSDFAIAGPFGISDVSCARYPGSFGDGFKISICPSAKAFKTIVTNVETKSSGEADKIVFAAGADDFLAVGSRMTATVSGATVERTIIARVSATEWQLDSAVATPYITLGSSVQFRWEYYEVFGIAPSTSPYIENAGGTNDEIHAVVIDGVGKVSGLKGQVLEKYSFMSKVTTAKKEDGAGNYWVNVLNQKSRYVRILENTIDSNVPAALTNTDPTTAFIDAAPITEQFAAGSGADSTPTDGDVESGYDMFANAELVDVALVMLANYSTNVARYVINNICESRKDCIALVSPKMDSVVGEQDPLTSVLLDREDLQISTSYAVMDNNWKYMYDKYNDTYRWVPLNGDIAGLCVRTDTQRDPWWSPAGLNRGQIKNAIKLAYNPDKADRDDLYMHNVNPVVSLPGQGIVLFGDKTLLSKPSAFDRINVRRLFIVLEKAIALAARFLLFEFNDDFTRASFKNMVEPYLRQVKAGRGVYDFKVVCDSTNNTPEIIDSNQFVGDIYIKPARSINFIQLNFIAVRTGVAFEEIVGKF